MIFTPEERRALLALGAILVFGQALAWWQGWRESRPDRELSAWLDQVTAARRAELPADAPPGDPADPAGEEDPAVRDPELPAEIPVGSARDLPPGLLSTGRLRVDLATAEELTTLPGIGPALASRIVEARARAPFERPEDLLRVKGIGPKTFERLRDRISIGPAGDVPPNLPGASRFSPRKAPASADTTGGDRAFGRESSAPGR